jgi:hypothetical protein
MIIVSGNNGRTTYGPSTLVTNGLMFAYDAADRSSYTGSTVVNDLISNFTASLINGPIYASDNAGCIQFDNINDYMQVNSTASINYDQNSNFTMEVGHKFLDDFGNWRLDNINYPTLSYDSGVFDKGQGGNQLIGIDVSNTPYVPGGWWKASKTFIDNTGNIIIVGGFTSYDTTNCNNIVRISSTGSVDSSFVTNIGNGFNTYCYDAATQSDNKIIVVGGFTAFDGTAVGRICRLNTNGRLDNTFNIGGVGTTGDIFSVWVDSFDNIYCGGAFSSYNGVSSRNNFVILSPTGSFLYTTRGSGLNGNVYKVYGANEGIYLGGVFTGNSALSTTFSRIVRVTTTGLYDASFAVLGTVGFDNGVYSITKDSAGLLYIGGDFNTYNGISSQKIIRLSTDGSIDPTFVVGTGFTNSSNNTGTVFNITPVGTQSIYVGGTFIYYNGLTASCAVRLSYTGSVDSSWPSIIGIAQGSNTSNTTTVNLIQDFNFIGSNILMSGRFNNWLGTQKNRLVMVSSTGSIVATASWYSGTGLNYKIVAYRYRTGVRGVNLPNSFTIYSGGNRATASIGCLSLIHYTGSNWNTVTTYVNGVSASSFTYSTNVIFTTGLPYIINSISAVGGNNSYIGGKIFYARLYNRALNDAEILQNFNSVRGRFNL